MPTLPEFMNAFAFLPADMTIADIIPMDVVRTHEPMARHTTLRVGGPARYFWATGDLEALATALPKLYAAQIPYLLIGHGSNLLFSDQGFPGVVIQNRCKQTHIDAATGMVGSECGVSLGSLFAQTQRAALSGLEWAIGIPGTVGGALVSNAGAYRGNIGPLVREVRAVYEGRTESFAPEWLEFAYRDSRLRSENPPRTVILSVTLQLTPHADADAVLRTAKRYQARATRKAAARTECGFVFQKRHRPGTCGAFRRSRSCSQNGGRSANRLSFDESRMSRVARRGGNGIGKAW